MKQAEQSFVRNSNGYSLYRESINDFDMRFFRKYGKVFYYPRLKRISFRCCIGGTLKKSDLEYAIAIMNMMESENNGK